MTGETFNEWEIHTRPLMFRLIRQGTPDSENGWEVDLWHYRKPGTASILRELVCSSKDRAREAIAELQEEFPSAVVVNEAA